MIIKKENCGCISCGSMLSDDLVLIGDQYPSAVFANKNDDISKKITSTSLNLCRCTNDACALVQLKTQYDLQYVFDHYPYESNTTATMGNILKDIVDETLAYVPVTSNDVILDIGGNDGTLLSYIPNNVKTKINIDAAFGVEQIINDKNYVYKHDKFNHVVYNSLTDQNPKIIFCVAMFYHLSNPVDFCQSISKIMNEDSVWVLQMTYLGTMLEDNILDNIVHEHAAYYSLHSLEHLLHSVGLKIAEAKLVSSYGGSLRVYIVKDNNTIEQNFSKEGYKQIQSFEKINKTNTYEALCTFNSKVHLLKNILQNFIEFIKTDDIVWGFGASTKGNMLLQFLNIDVKTIPYILDNNNKKIGTTTLGSKIPIISEKDNWSQIPKYLLILPYYYTDAFIKIIKKHISIHKSVTLIVPLPYPKFIKITGEKND